MARYPATEPDYWMYETSGALRPAIEAYLFDRPMTWHHIAAMRSYLQQWIFAPVWTGPGIRELRAGIDGLVTREAIHEWLDLAMQLGIDPL